MLPTGFQVCQENRTALLLDEAQRGSNSSLGLLLQAYRDYLLVLADDELGSDLKVKAGASDLVQESFAEAMRDFEQFDGTTPAEFQSWLRRLLLHNIANVARGFRGTEKRDLSRESPLSRNDGTVPSALIAADPSASSIVLRDELIVEVQAAVKRLPKHYQQVIVLRNFERASFEEIGRQLGRSTEAAQQLWIRALKALEKELNSPDDTRIHRSARERSSASHPV